MAEPTSAATAAGLAAVLATITEVTGLQVPLMIWAAIGGYWSFRYVDAMSLASRGSSVAISSLIGAVAAEPAAAVAIATARHFLSWWPAEVGAGSVSWLVAAVIGLLCHPVIGRGLIAVGSRRVQQASEVSK